MLEMIRAYAGFFFPNRIGLLPRVARGVFDRIVLRRPHLRVAEVATTFTCNSKCVMCSCSKFSDSAKEANRMNVSEYASLARQLDKLGCVSVNITGGEPLMRPDITEVIAAFGPRAKIVNLITNGLKLTEERVKEFASLGVASIVVSLESTDPEENDRIRGHKGHFEAVVSAMKWARDARLKFGLSLTLGDFNFAKVDELAAFAKDNGAFLCIAHGGSIGNWKDNHSVHLSLPMARRVLAMVRRRREMKIDFSANLSLRPGCPAIVEKIYVTPYGDVLPCTFNPLSFGNLREEPLAPIWRRMVKFRKEHVHDSRTLCMRTYDSRFIAEFLDPIRDMELPIRIDRHPFFTASREC